MIKKFSIGGMSCAACQAHVQKAVSKLEGVNKCEVNLLTNSMVVDYNEATLNDNSIIKAVMEAGYSASIFITKEDKETDKDLKHLLISAAFLVVLMYIAMGHMINLPISKQLCTPKNGIYFVLVQIALTLPIIIIYRKYFISGYKKLFKGAPNMDTLIAIGASASLIYGLYALVMIIINTAQNNMVAITPYLKNLYFESAAMILTLVSLGKYFEKKSKAKTLDALNKLMDLAPKKAVVFEDGKEILKDIQEVRVGDILVVKKGDSIPCDGCIVEGSASIDQSNITGESVPVYKKVEDGVYTSTILTSGYIKIRAEKVGEDTSIANIIKLVEEAANSKAPISKLADKISRIFVPVVFVIAAITFIVNIIYHKDFALAFNFAISVVVISCPCALGLATPVAIMVGTGKGAESGLLIKNAEILEKAQNIKTIVFDKTGTITMGRPSVVNLIKYDKHVLQVAYSLERLSEHPLADAIVRFAEEKKEQALVVDDFKSIDGVGISGRIDGKIYYVGNLNVLKELDITFNESEYHQFATKGEIPLIVASKDGVLGIISIKDQIKATSIKAITALSKIGVKSIMLTGDNKETAQAIAKEVGIEEVYSDVLPQDKQQIVKSLINKDGLVAMVGDGVNDALALMEADLGIAIGGGSDIARDSADIILIRNDLMDIKNIINLSKKTFRTIKGNLFWAFFYNCIGIFMASGIFYVPFNIALNPMMGALAMSLSSVFVVLNALTINLFKPDKNESEIIEERIEELSKSMEIKIGVDGMMCNHCVKHVREALLRVEGVEEANPSLEEKCVYIKGQNLKLEDLEKAIEEADYKVIK